MYVKKIQCVSPILVSPVATRILPFYRALARNGGIGKE